jgi:acetylornithine deacetylase/succinyl-diaminopimelate desuccinylase-like protein
MPSAAITSIVIVEGCEESGSFDLPYYIDLLEDRIGSPDLVVCLDAECGNYEQLWCTTSLRGNLTGTLRVDVLTEGVHSGSASGVVPSSFRTARQLIQLISRIEDEDSGQIKLGVLHADIPEQRIEQARLASETLQDLVYEKFPWAVDNPKPSESHDQLMLNNTWRPTLAVTGQEGMPDLINAGNVLLPYTVLKMSFRLPPTVERIRAWLDGTHLRSHRGSKRPCTKRRTHFSANRRCTWVPVERSRSWACWASAFLKLSS